MRVQTLRTIAGKEFRDHVRSRRFLALLAVILIITGTGTFSGMVQFHKSLDRYHDALTVVSGEDEPFGTSTSSKPSIMWVFHMIEMTTATLSAFMGIAMGFDLVTREKESKSLKILLSNPIYRDEVITGKALGGVAAIALAVAIALGVSCAVLLIGGIVLSPTQMIRTLIFGLFTVLFIATFFMIALFFSTIASESGTAFIASVLVLVLIAVILPFFAYNPMVLDAVLGEPPECPEEAYSTDISYEESLALLDEYDAENEAYWNTRNTLITAAMISSPAWIYNAATAAVTALPPADDGVQDYSPGTILSTLLNSWYIFAALVAMLVMPAFFFGLAWVKFARMDLR
ncbi:ABC transporter permease [Methanofollis aquaemaris]|nr:ABC transporter permease subunit [Methanofollis aquaemaris]